MRSRMTQVRTWIEANEGVDTIRAEVPLETVEKAVAACKDKAPVDTSSFLLPGESLTSIMARALRRGKIIAETNPVDFRTECRKRVFVRQRDREHDANEVWVVSTANYQNV